MSKASRRRQRPGTNPPTARPASAPPPTGAASTGPPHRRRSTGATGRVATGRDRRDRAPRADRRDRRDRRDRPPAPPARTGAAPSTLPPGVQPRRPSRAPAGRRTSRRSSSATGRRSSSSPRSPASPCCRAFVFFSASQPAFACSTIWTPDPTASPAAGATPALGYVQPDMGHQHVARRRQGDLHLLRPGVGQPLQPAGHRRSDPRPRLRPERQRHPAGLDPQPRARRPRHPVPGRQRRARRPRARPQLRAFYDSFPTARSATSRRASSRRSSPGSTR